MFFFKFKTLFLELDYINYLIPIQSRLRFYKHHPIELFFSNPIKCFSFLSPDIPPFVVRARPLESKLKVLANIWTTRSENLQPLRCPFDPEIMWNLFTCFVPFHPSSLVPFSALFFLSFSQFIWLEMSTKIALRLTLILPNPIGSSNDTYAWCNHFPFLLLILLQKTIYSFLSLSRFASL